ncbi:MAG: helix-turn-helix domain-containing protein [Candidatus Dormibacteraceae bacterium]
MPRPSPAVRDLKLSQRLGEVVKRGRQEIGLSQPGLAKKTGLSRSYISYLESGKYQEIGIAKLALIAEALEMSADQLLADAGYIKRPKSTLPGATRYLATKFGLDQSQVTSALQYLAFLQSRKKAKRAVKR